MHHNIPPQAPAELHWLFTEEQPGTRIQYSFRCPYGQAIYKFHRDLPEVKRYTAELRAYLEDGCRAERTSKLGTKRVLTAKSAMVDAVLRHYGRFRIGSKKELRRELYEANRLVAQLDGQLLAANWAAERLRAALEKATGVSGAELERLIEEAQ